MPFIKLECEYCKCTFTHTKSRYKHYKTCKEKNNPSPVQEPPQEQEQEITTNTPIIYDIGDETIDLSREYLNTLKLSTNM